jgi:hypothetical protein
VLQPLANNSLDRNRRIIKKVAFMLHNFCQKQNDGPPLMDSLPAELINGYVPNKKNLFKETPPIPN